MTFNEYRYLVLADMYRVSGRLGVLDFFKTYLLSEGFKYLFWVRTCSYTRNHLILRYFVYPFSRLYLRKLTYKFGIDIPFQTRIGPGFYVGHFGSIVVNGGCVIGKNCNISHGVTLGRANRGKRKGVPVIGNGVYIGPGAKVVGGVRVGNNVAIGANCVVTTDIPDHSVVIGVPGRVISNAGAQGYVNRTDYEIS